MRALVCLICLLWMAGSQAPLAAERQHPDCTGHDRWPASSVGTRLRELGLSDKAGGYDTVEVELLASEPLSPELSPNGGRAGAFSSGAQGHHPRRGKYVCRHHRP